MRSFRASFSIACGHLALLLLCCLAPAFSHAESIVLDEQSPALSGRLSKSSTSTSRISSTLALPVIRSLKSGTV